MYYNINNVIINLREVNNMATKTSDTAIREVIEKALSVYDIPEVCIRIALAFIDGLKTGAIQSELEKQEG